MGLAQARPQGGGGGRVLGQYRRPPRLRRLLRNPLRQKKDRRRDSRASLAVIVAEGRRIHPRFLYAEQLRGCSVAIAAMPRVTEETENGVTSNGGEEVRLFDVGE